MSSAGTTPNEVRVEEFKQIVKHVFDAMSSLSDAQEQMRLGSAHSAVTHAKIHLNTILEEYPEIAREVFGGSIGQGCDCGPAVIISSSAERTGA